MSTLARLREIMPQEVIATDLPSTYAFAHPLNAMRTGFATVDPRTNGVCWSVDFFTENAEKVLEDGRPLTRRVDPARLVIGSGRSGVVAYHALFYIREEFRRKRLASAVFASEQELYARWGVAQIQLVAADQGVAYWVRQHGFVPDDWGYLRGRLAGWLAKRRLPEIVPTTPAELPWDYLMEQGTMVVYKDLQ